MFLIVLIAQNWPCFGADLGNTHLVSGRGAMTSVSQPVFKWSHSASSSSWGESGVSVVDLDGDGVAEVMSSFWLGGVDAVHGDNGSVFWTVNISDAWNSVPAAIDVDSDDTIEVFVSSWGDGDLYCINGITGAIQWHSPTGQSTSESSPKIADLDGDGEMEVVVGAWYGSVVCFNALTGATEWSVNLGGNVDHAPAVAQLDDDPGLEVVVGSDGQGLFCLDGATGNTDWSITSTENFGWASPMIADVDADGQPEVVASFGGVLHFYSADGTSEGSCSLSSSSNSSPGAAQLDDDPALEVVVGSENTMFCVDGATHAQQWSYDLGSEVHRGPAIADIDGDGQLEVIFTGRSDQVVCLNQDGSQEWSYTTSTTDVHDPAVADIDGDGCLEVVFALAADSDNLVAIDDPTAATDCDIIGTGETRQGSDLFVGVAGGVIRLELDREMPVDLDLYDVSGRLVKRLYSGQLGRGSHEFVPAGLVHGTYMVVLRFPGGIRSLKLVK